MFGNNYPTQSTSVFFWYFFLSVLKQTTQKTEKKKMSLVFNIFTFKFLQPSSFRLAVENRLFCHYSDALFLFGVEGEAYLVAAPTSTKETHTTISASLQISAVAQCRCATLTIPFLALLHVSVGNELFFFSSDVRTVSNWATYCSNRRWEIKWIK